MISQEERNRWAPIFVVASKYDGSDAYIRAQMDALLMFFGPADPSCAEFLLAKAAEGPKRRMDVEGQGWDVLELSKAKHELVKSGKVGQGSLFWLMPKGVTDDDIRAQRKAEASAKKAELDAAKPPTRRELARADIALSVSSMRSAGDVYQGDLAAGTSDKLRAAPAPKGAPSEGWVARKMDELTKLAEKYVSRKREPELEDKIVELLEEHRGTPAYASQIAKALGIEVKWVRRSTYQAAAAGKITAVPIFGRTGFAFQALDAPSE